MPGGTDLIAVHGRGGVSVRSGGSHLRVAAPALQIDGRAGLGSVLIVSPGGPVVVVVVDFGPPGVRGDDPHGGSPLLQGVRRFHPLLDFIRRPHGSVRRRRHALPCKRNGFSCSGRTDSQFKTRSRSLFCEL